MTETAKKPRKPRNLGMIVVQVLNGGGVWVDVGDMEPTTYEEAAKWIKDEAASGYTYRVARVYPAVKVGVVTSEVRTLAPAV